LAARIAQFISTSSVSRVHYYRGHVGQCCVGLGPLHTIVLAARGGVDLSGSRACVLCAEVLCIMLRQLWPGGVLAPDCGCAVLTVCRAKVTRFKCVAWETCDLGRFRPKRLMRNFAACLNSNTPPRSQLQNHVVLCCMTCSPSPQTSVPLSHTYMVPRILNRFRATSCSARHDAPDTTEQRIVWTAAHAV
jgi:hypothetical protein